MGKAVLPNSKPSGPGHLDHDALKSSLGYQLARATIVTNRIFKENVEAVYGLNKLEFTTLMLTGHNAGTTPKRLSVALNIPGPNLTPLLVRLEARGYLQREKSDTDRRVQYLQLTPAGQELLARLKGTISTMEKDALAHLSPAEQAMLFELLHKVSSPRKAG